MRDFRDAKAVLAHTLREALKAKSVSLTHSESLELVAKALGFPDWNFLAAKIQHSQPASAASEAPPPTAGLEAMPAGAIVGRADARVPANDRADLRQDQAA